MTSRKRNPNGAGSIWQRKDGRFEARVYVPQPDGTRKRKTVYGSTWDECDEKRQELVRRDRQGIPTPSRSAKLSEWLPYWLEEYIRPQRKRTTYVKYEMHVRLYLVPLLGSRRLESLTTANVRQMISKVTEQASAATAKEAHRVLRTALTAACRDELISRNVVQLVPAPRVEPRELHPWSLDETLTFLEAARTDPLYPAFVLAVALGLRRGEILGLQWRDVDLDRRTHGPDHAEPWRQGAVPRHDQEPASKGDPHPADVRGAAPVAASASSRPPGRGWRGLARQ